MRGTAIDKFRKANGSFVKMDSCDYNMHKVSSIPSLELQYKWMLMATPLVNGIEDLHWILCFLQSSSWLSLQLPPDTFNYTFNIDEDWDVVGNNGSGTEGGAGFTSVGDSYKRSPDFGSLVHCTTMAWDAYMLPIIGEVGKLRNAMQTSNILIRWHCYEETIGM